MRAAAISCYPGNTARRLTQVKVDESESPLRFNLDGFIRITFAFPPIAAGTSPDFAVVPFAEDQCALKLGRHCPPVPIVELSE